MATTCPDCRGSGKYISTLSIEDCRTCGGSGDVGAVTVPTCDGIYPLRPEDFGELDVMDLVGTGRGHLEIIHRPEQTRYALHWRCIASNTLYSRFLSTSDLSGLDLSKPVEMSVEDADGPVLMSFLDNFGQVTLRAWVQQA